MVPDLPQREAYSAEAGSERSVNDNSQVAGSAYLAYSSPGSAHIRLSVDTQSAPHLISHNDKGAGSNMRSSPTAGGRMDVSSVLNHHRS